MWHDDQLDRLPAYMWWLSLTMRMNVCVRVYADFNFNRCYNNQNGKKYWRNISTSFLCAALFCSILAHCIYCAFAVEHFLSTVFSSHSGIWVQYMHITMFYPRNVGRYWHFDRPWKSICNASNRIPIVGSVMCVHNLKIGLFAAIAVAFVCAPWQ